MGSLIQQFRLSEEDFRGERFKDHPKLLKGDNDLLSITRPDVISSIYNVRLAAPLLFFFLFLVSPALFFSSPSHVWPM